MLTKLKAQDELIRAQLDGQVASQCGWSDAIYERVNQQVAAQIWLRLQDALRRPSSSKTHKRGD